MPPPDFFFKKTGVDHTRCQVHTGTDVSLLAPEETAHSITPLATQERLTRIYHAHITTHTHVTLIKSIGKKKERKRKEKEDKMKI